ncbi:MAG TPA: hypothetical protein DCG57_07025 [Candidatus Riflebacteria bacterium]|nr:hypothetical protein [Candidatus Riflebacteria bacterium]
MKKLIIGLLVIGIVGFSGIVDAKSSAKPSGVLINGLQYEAGLASSAVAHKDICAILYGASDSNVGGDKESHKMKIGGAPFAYSPLADGSFWVLDTINQKMKHFAADGKLISCFTFPGSSSEKFVKMQDMAVIPTGGFYLYDSVEGMVIRVDDKGMPKAYIEGLPNSREIGIDSKGNLLVANPVMHTLLRFNPAGELIERYDGQTFLSTVVDANDRPLGVKFNDLEAELFRADKASPTVTVSLAKFPLQTPKERNARYVSAQLIGSDAKKNVYLQLIACDKLGVIHQYRFLRLSSDGKTLGQADFLAVAFLYPRKKAITPDGKVFGFRSDKKSWFPITFALP